MFAYVVWFACDFYSSFLTVTREGDNYRWLIHPEMLNGATNGTMYVNITVFNYTSSRPVTVNVTLMNFKCVYWDVNQNDWSRDGCWVSVSLSIKMAQNYKRSTNIIQVIGDKSVRCVITVSTLSHRLVLKQYRTWLTAYVTITLSTGAPSSWCPIR